MANNQNHKAVAYIRVSTAEQTKFGVSLETQEARLQAYCQMAGLELTAMLREESVSASIPLAKRPSGAKLLEHLSGDVRHVVAFKLDRLFRDAEDALRQTKAWDRAGVALHLVDIGGQSMNTGSAMGRMFLTLMAGFAELERNLIAERTTAVLAHKKQLGRVYNHEPFGFRRVGDKLVALVDEMAVVHLMRERREDGWSLGMISDALNRDGVSSKNGGKWHRRTVKNILDNSLYRRAVIEVVGSGLERLVPASALSA
jgi:DNA invertase Pin-like site-specific DNA recombinase